MYKPELSENFVIEELWYVPMGEHNPVFNRPYVVNVTENTVDNIVEKMLENNSTSVSPTLLGQVHGNIIQPNVVGEISMIDNTWVTDKRFIFVLKVRSTCQFGTETCTYIQGYTDHDGITPNGVANERMVHHINNVIETVIHTIPTPLGVTRTEKLHKTYNVLTHNNHDYYTQRPKDVIDNLEMLNVTDHLSHGNIEVEGVSTGNWVNPFNENVVSSASSNSVGNEYLSKVINGGIAKVAARDITTDSFEMHTDSSMGQEVLEPSINDNRFIRYLSTQGGFRSVKEYFTFGALAMIDPTIRDRFHLIQISKAYNNPLLHTTPAVGEFWSGQDPITLKAYSLIESSVSMGTRYGFNKLCFTATNMSNPEGFVDIAITDFKSFINLCDADIARLLDLFKNKFVMDVFISESEGGLRPMYMEMYMDLLGTSKIKLGYSGYPETWYTIPTPANSMFSPVLTVDKSALDAVSVQFGNLVDTITNHESNYRSYY